MTDDLPISILALEPYYGGSHRAFLDGWRHRSRHAFAVLGLPAYKWKWRMRHAAITFAEEVNRRYAAGERWDAVFCSSMLNLAEFRGLAHPEIRALPTVVYFHENQLTYPVRHESERDYHFAFTNLTTGLAADAAWFNSAFNRDSLLTALPKLLKRMPDYQPFEAIERIHAKSAVQPPGIDVDELAPRADRRIRRFGSNDGRDARRTPETPLHILWAARWEHDKNPEALFAALHKLRSKDIPLCLSVIGEQFRDSPPVFDAAHEAFADAIVHWGYLPTREAYVRALQSADVIVSTADHEFFGLTVLEAIAAGCRPLLPRRLAYPEILDVDQQPQREQYLYSDGPEMLATRLCELATGAIDDDANLADRRAIVTPFDWRRRAQALDAAISAVIAR